MRKNRVRRSKDRSFFYLYMPMNYKKVPLCIRNRKTENPKNIDAENALATEPRNVLSGSAS